MPNDMVSGTEEQVEFLYENVEDWSRNRAEEWVYKINNAPNSLTCEKLIEPLEKTGGEICLRVEWENSSEPWYYTIRSHTELDILLHHHNNTIDAAHEEAETRLRQDRTHDLATITPVRRTETPFEKTSIE